MLFAKPRLPASLFIYLFVLNHTACAHVCSKKTSIEATHTKTQVFHFLADGREFIDVTASANKETLLLTAPYNFHLIARARPKANFPFAKNASLNALKRVQGSIRQTKKASVAKNCGFCCLSSSSISVQRSMFNRD